MENVFTEFSEYTVSGDHEEANEVIQRLSHHIQETEEEMEEVPPLLTMLDEVYDEEIADLSEGYKRMVASGYRFPDDSIEADINQLAGKRDQIYDYIGDLQLEHAQKASDELGQEIDALYDKLELEIQAKEEVADLIADTKRAVYYLRDENHRLETLINRIAQSYFFMHEEPEKVIALSDNVEECQKDYMKVAEKVKNQSIPYSEAYNELDDIFNELDHLNAEYIKITETLENYRKEELELQEEMDELEQSMYEIKRRLENERLPGLPDDYLELFFSTSDRIEQFSMAMSRPKIQLNEVRKIRDVCREDVTQLNDMTDEIIRQVELTERVSQRLYRYKDSHKGVLETIRYSESLFIEEYEYDTALRLVREKLENVDPGAYDEVVEEYENEQTI
jgi:septation ring formation regulator